jgi:hypothetical protein
VERRLSNSNNDAILDVVKFQVPKKLCTTIVASILSPTSTHSWRLSFIGLINRRDL